jgi:type IV secretory pathway VirJ component
MTKIRSLLLAMILATVLPAAGIAEPAQRQIKADAGDIGQVEVLAPAGEPSAFIIFLSDRDGLTPERRAEAGELVSRGAAVALVDVREAMKRKAANEGGECHYIFADFEDLAHTAQRQLAMETWRQPLLFGVGEGGTLAYLALAQAPHNVAAGAVSLGFDTHFESKLLLCGGAPKIAAQGMVYTYGPARELPGRWTWIADQAPQGDLAEFATAGSETTVKLVGDAAESFTAAADAAFAIAASPAEPLAGLPLIELPAGGAPSAMVVLISGDGGWSSIDRQIGNYLSAHGVAVVGVDSLRYFWSKKDPRQIAADLDRIVAHYQAQWHVARVGLLGYSFGADVLPIAWDKLSRETQSAASVIGLLGLEPMAELQISVEGWLGMASSTEIPVRPYLAGLPPQKVMCIYGAEEKDNNETACTFSEFDRATRLERPGGHHFDGDYQPIAESIRTRLETDEAQTHHLSPSERAASVAQLLP